MPVEQLIFRGVSAGVKLGGDGVILWEPRPGGRECAFVYDTTVVAGGGRGGHRHGRTAVPAWVTAGAVAVAAGLALLLPVLPYALELLALRRLTAAAFGTLMSIEPAVALVVGVAVLGQAPRPTQALGVLLVAVAACGAARTGRRPPPTPDSYRHNINSSNWSES